MNTQEYIESGMLEAYVLGTLSATEEQQVLADLVMYPDLVAELKVIEEALLQYAQNNAVQPPAGLQDKIWESINGDVQAEKEPEKTAKVIPLKPNYEKRFDWKYAAVILLLLGSVVLNFVLWKDNRDQKGLVSDLNERTDMLFALQKDGNELLGQYKEIGEMMADTAMQTIIMHTQVPGHPMAATLYWNKTKGDAHVVMNVLPPPPAGMQYQLWVIQNGRPVSMGTLPNHMANTPGLMKVDKQVTSGDAFAISLEKEGGSPSPTTVYVMGKA